MTIDEILANIKENTEALNDKVNDLKNERYLAAHPDLAGAMSFVANVNGLDK